MTVRKKVIKRRKSGVSKKYFTKETDAAIIEFQSASSQLEKETLFREKILPAFEKLVESLVWVYGFKSVNGMAATLDEPVEPVSRGSQAISYGGNMKYDCVSFLYESLHKWDPERGTKAFSYFNVVAKNWLITHSKKQHRKVHSKVYIDDVDNLSAKDKADIESHNYVPSPDEHVRTEDVRKSIELVIAQLKAQSDTDKEMLCLTTIEDLFERIDELDFLNKRAVYLYLREMSGLGSDKLPGIMALIRKKYKRITGGRGLMTDQLWENFNVEDEEEE